MTLDDLRALADKFFVWPEGSGRQTVTTFSALLFAQHVLQLREKSLGTENSAGMDALRDAAQRQLDALGGYRREIGLLTGVPDEQPCDAEVAARAALGQQAEPAWVCPESPEHRYAKPGHCEDCGKTLVLEQQAEPKPVAWRIRAVGSMGWSGPWRAYWQSARPGVDEPQFFEFEPLYTHPPIQRAHGIGEEYVAESAST